MSFRIIMKKIESSIERKSRLDYQKRQYLKRKFEETVEAKEKRLKRGREIFKRSNEDESLRAVRLIRDKNWHIKHRKCENLEQNNVNNVPIPFGNR